MDTQIDDESNDRKYFSLLPHIVLNHSTAVDQALYMQMKRYAGENRKGECFASHNNLRKKLGVGKHAFAKSLAYLLGRGWIYRKGTRMVETPGGIQMVTVYGIKDIWKENIKQYQGGAKSDYLPKGSPKTMPKVGLNQPKVVQKQPSNKNQEEELEQEGLKLRKKAESTSKEIYKILGRKKK